ncbi:MAG TPA: rhodanese-like domain-containing protein [Fulvivirga sp.]|nr:rhodanese-like domain-containing protein [Fulvivirga sp.]
MNIKIFSRCSVLFTLLFSMCMGQTDFNSRVNSIISGNIPLIHQDSLSTMLSSNRQPVLIDARSIEEYEVSHIKGAKFVDYDSFSPDMVNGIDKDEEVVVYCSIGYRSEKIGEKLKEMGYTNVLNLYGGIFDWKNNGHEVVDGQNVVTDSVHTYNKNWSKWLYKGIKVYE